MKKFLAGLGCLAAESLAGLYVVNPSELKDDFGPDGQVKAKLSNIGFGYFQKGTSRIG